jgi:hypothetical protein
MIQLPYRERENDSSGGYLKEGDLMPNGYSVNSQTGELTKVHPMVSAAKEEAVNRGPVQFDTETFTKKRPSYKSKWEEEVKEKKRWRLVAFALIAFAIGSIITQVWIIS